MQAGPAPDPRYGVARQVRRAVLATTLGALTLLVLVLIGNWASSNSEHRENAYHRRAIALADRLSLAIPTVQLPPGVEFASGEARVSDPIAFEAAAERTFGGARAVAEQLADLHRRFDHARDFERANARIALGLQGLVALREQHARDRRAFAQALATSPTYLEIVALQVRRQHEAALTTLLDARRRAVLWAQVAAALILAGVVFGTGVFVRRSMAAIESILADDARRSAELAQSLADRSAALREKDTLLQEVYHRVKNNLQIVSSLLNMQGREINDPEALRLLRDSANRVQAMALVHEQLYRSDDLGKISCRELVEQLAARLTEAYAPASRNVRVVTHTDDLELGLDRAIPCALILNELVANAFMHAYGPDAAGTIDVTLEGLAQGRAHLVVADDGRGLACDFSPETASTLGVRIVATLARQLSGELECSSDSGTRCEVVFDREA